MVKWIAALALAASCAQEPPPPAAVEPDARAAYEELTAKSMIVGKPALVRLGLKPLKLEEARGYMNALFAALEPDLERTNITYQMAGNDIILTIQAHLIIERQGGGIARAIAPQLEGIAKTLVKYNRSFVEFRGHTSSEGAHRTNLARSFNEASSVADWFMERGVIPQRVFVNGMGEKMWVVDNSTREGRLLNHRIEIRIAPLI